MPSPVVAASHRQKGLDPALAGLGRCCVSCVIQEPSNAMLNSNLYLSRVMFCGVSSTFVCSNMSAIAFFLYSERSASIREISPFSSV